MIINSEVEITKCGIFNENAQKNLRVFSSTAKITKVEVVSQRTAVAGMTYYVQIGKGTTVNNFNWAPNISWASTVNTTYFNNQNPYDFWALRFYATRVITPPDYGAGATVSSATLRVYWN